MALKGNQATLLDDVRRRGHGPRNRATLKRVALSAVRIVTGKNPIRHTMREAVLNMQLPADILNHMPVA